MYRRLENTSGTSHALMKLGLVAARRKDYEGANRFFEESLALQRGLGELGSVFYSLSNLGSIAHKRGDVPLAMARYREALELLESVPNKAAIAGTLELFAAALTAAGEPQRAARLLGATDALRTLIGSPVFPSERADYEAAISSTRAALGDRQFETEWQMGAVMNLARTLEEARGAREHERTPA